MEQMLDQGTKDYFNAMFKNTDDKLDKVILTVERIDGKVVEHDVRLTLLEKDHNDHIKSHGEKGRKKEWRLELWVIIFIFAIDKLWQYFPTP